MKSARCQVMSIILLAAFLLLPVAAPAQRAEAVTLFGAANHGFFNRVFSGYSVARYAAVDGEGFIYVAGTTNGPGVPAVNALQPAYTEGYFISGWPMSMRPCADIFVAKLSPDGGELLFSTHLGDSRNNHVHGFAVDREGAVYLTGSGRDGWFVAKIRTDEPQIAYWASLEAGLLPAALAVDADGAAYLTGYSTRPTQAFVLKMIPDGSGVEYLRRFGGSAGEDIAVDESGQVYVAGKAVSPDFPVTPDAIQPTLGGRSDAFLLKLNPDGTTALATFLGGSGWEQNAVLALASGGPVHVAFMTSSDDIPFASPRQTTGSNVFVAKLAAGGGRMIYGTYLGDLEEVADLAIDDTGRAIVAGGVTVATLSLAGRVDSLLGVAPVEAVTVAGGALIVAGTSDVGGAHLAYVARIDPLAPPAGLRLTDVQNGASFQTGPLAPGEIVTLRGAGFASEDGVEVLFDDTPASLLYVGDRQINAVVPINSVDRPAVRVRVRHGDELSNSFTLPVVPAVPGVFSQGSTGSGRAVLLNADGSLNTVENPAAAGTVVTFFATGVGEMPIMPVRVLLGPWKAEVVSVTESEVSGVFLVKARLPADLRGGDNWPLELQVGNAVSPNFVLFAVE